MALYKDPARIRLSSDQAFDRVHPPGTATPLSGIYVCTGCGREVVSTEHHPLPPQNHHQHLQNNPHPIQWRLAVYASHLPIPGY